MTTTYNFDVVILGGGPAGLSSAIYAARGNLSTAIIDINTFGGQPVNYTTIENYPGFVDCDSFLLMENFEKQAQDFGVKTFSMQEILSIDFISPTKTVVTTEAKFNSKTVIIATGATPQKLGIVGEEEFIGRGVSYCAVCDGAFYKDKIVTVVGGGNSAIEEAIYLTKFAKKVYLVHRRNEFRADKLIQSRLNDCKEIEVIYNTTVKAIHGKDNVTSISLCDLTTNNCYELETNGVFPYIGICPNVELFSGQLKQDIRGFIVTDETMKTSIDGVFAVGDVRVTPLRQVITAAADGAIGAVYATKYIEENKNKILQQIQK